MFGAERHAESEQFRVFVIYTGHTILRIVKFRSPWTKIRTGETQNAYRILVGKSLDLFLMHYPIIWRRVWWK